MEFYIIILFVLFVTAISDLVVGVSNDAINFINSAIGSKAAKRKTIMIVAGLGVLIGTTFSSGMMEVARKGIFNPEYFSMHEVMIIFVAVMLTDILLLDLYNTFALPTSTTVSIVFEIFGGAVAIALIKISNSSGHLVDILSYINTVNVIKIVAGIGLSVVFAFLFGFLIQFITRLVFTFNYKKMFRRFGSIYCGIALTIISFFILIKGAKGSSLVTPEANQYIMSHLNEFLLISFIFWTVVWHLIIQLTKINVLKTIVLIGTFALALAFAANDLVNFIGAPLGALSAYNIGMANSSSDPLAITMGALKNPVKANTWILLLAGVMMVITLWKSKKARSVSQTELRLGRQEEGTERFESISLARGIVRMGISAMEIVRKITPQKIQRGVIRRINPANFEPEPDIDGERPAFDLLRAAVNLTVASALVSFGTSLKLPLSTTFVTFMVAMSTSLADKSWGRESAVYRITGVLTVFGGWFFTAFMAFTACFLFSLFIYYVKLPAIIILVILGLYFLIRTGRLHKLREEKYRKREVAESMSMGESEGIQQIMLKLSKYFMDVAHCTEECCDGLIQNKRKILKKKYSDAKNLFNESDSIIRDIVANLKFPTITDHEATPTYARKIGNLQIISSNLNSIAKYAFEHIDNNHKPPTIEQAEELKNSCKKMNQLFSLCSEIVETQNFTRLNEANITLENMVSWIRKADKNQLKRIKAGESKSRQSLLFISTLSKMERIAKQVYDLMKLFNPA